MDIDTCWSMVLGNAVAFSALYWLFHDAWFLNTAVGRWLVTVFVYCDVNGVAFPMDSTTVATKKSKVAVDEEEGKDAEEKLQREKAESEAKKKDVRRKEANESLAKCAYGWDVPHLTDKNARTWIPMPSCFGFGNKSCPGSISYYQFLRGAYQLDQDLAPSIYDDSYARCKEVTWEFTNVNQPGHNYYQDMFKKYDLALQREGDLSEPFESWFDEMRNAKRSIVISFHSFGKDLGQMRKILTAKKIQHDLFAITHDVDTGEAAYIQVLPIATNQAATQEELHYSQIGLSEEEFYQEMWKQERIFLVQHNHARWEHNHRDPNKGKLALLVWSLFRIAIGIVLDDNICWQLKGKHTGAPNFVRVVPYYACTEMGYFQRVFKPSSILKTAAFWNYVWMLGTVASFFVYWLSFGGVVVMCAWCCTMWRIPSWSGAGSFVNTGVLFFIFELICVYILSWTTVVSFLVLLLSGAIMVVANVIMDAHSK